MWKISWGSLQSTDWQQMITNPKSWCPNLGSHSGTSVLTLAMQIHQSKNQLEKSYWEFWPQMTWKGTQNWKRSSLSASTSSANWSSQLPNRYLKNSRRNLPDNLEIWARHLLASADQGKRSLALVSQWHQLVFNDWMRLLCYSRRSNRKSRDEMINKLGWLSVNQLNTEVRLLEVWKPLTEDYCLSDMFTNPEFTVRYNCRPKIYNLS